MYILIGILFIICILFFVINYHRKKRIIRKICCMDCSGKLDLLNDLTEPFGFYYVPHQDIMSSQPDSWQREFGYSYLYDKTAPHFNMIFDCEPVYFDFDNRTWMIELWKGQYGINIGCEVGIYQADTIISPEQYAHTLFHSVPNDQMLPISIELNFKGRRLFYLHRTHWWLTGFYMGNYCEPEDLSLDISITFPCEEMLNKFVDSMFRIGYREYDLYICNLTVYYSFSITHTKQPRLVHPLLLNFTQWKNRVLCKLYNFITSPFTCTVDKLLYLYFFLPVMFRHLLCMKKNRKAKSKRKHKK